MKVAGALASFIDESQGVRRPDMDSPQKVNFHWNRIRRGTDATTFLGIELSVPIPRRARVLVAQAVHPTSPGQPMRILGPNGKAIRADQLGFYWQTLLDTSDNRPVLLLIDKAALIAPDIAKTYGVEVIASNFAMTVRRGGLDASCKSPDEAWYRFKPSRSELGYSPLARDFLDSIRTALYLVSSNEDIILGSQTVGAGRSGVDDADEEAPLDDGDDVDGGGGVVVDRGPLPVVLSDGVGAVAARPDAEQEVVGAKAPVLSDTDAAEAEIVPTGEAGVVDEGSTAGGAALDAAWAQVGGLLGALDGADSVAAAKEVLGELSRVSDLNRSDVGEEHWPELVELRKLAAVARATRDWTPDELARQGQGLEPDEQLELLRGLVAPLVYEGRQALHYRGQVAEDGAATREPGTELEPLPPLAVEFARQNRMEQLLDKQQKEADQLPWDVAALVPNDRRRWTKAQQAAAEENYAPRPIEVRPARGKAAQEEFLKAHAAQEIVQREVDQQLLAFLSKVNWQLASGQDMGRRGPAAENVPAEAQEANAAVQAFQDNSRRLAAGEGGTRELRELIGVLQNLRVKASEAKGKLQVLVGNTMARLVGLKSDGRWQNGANSRSGAERVCPQPRI